MLLPPPPPPAALLRMHYCHCHLCRHCCHSRLKHPYVYVHTTLPHPPGTNLHP